MNLIIKNELLTHKGFEILIFIDRKAFNLNIVYNRSLLPI